jgi:hypothetical protein
LRSSRATRERAEEVGATGFEDWLADRLVEGVGWDEVTTEILTATGDVRENGATGLIFAHDGEAEALAGEVSRIFLGIQIQCANCHDHPYDRWKREDFHTLAAFFPRVRVRRMPMSTPPTAEVVSFDLGQAMGGDAVRRNPELLLRQFDTDGDGKLTKDEVAETPFGGRFGQAIAVGDGDKDGALSLEELKSLPAPPNENRRTEWYMADLADPSTPGEVTRPRFFVDGAGAQLGTNDLNRRRRLAAAVTDESNVWFARAAVNRVWTELVGSGFYTPVDDLGPGREAACPDVLDLLCDGFVKSGYDLKWLLATVANTQAYERSVRTEALVSTGIDAPFAIATPTRMRADHVYAGIVQALGEPTAPRLPFFGPRPQGMPGMRFADRSPRRQVIDLFGYDPSTPHDEAAGDVPQALFLMNSPMVQSRLEARGDGPLAEIVAESDSPEQTVERLYLLTLSRRPTVDETRFCAEHVRNSPSRNDAYEDLLWSLLNSTEFVTKR